MLMLLEIHVFHNISVLLHFNFTIEYTVFFIDEKMVRNAFCGKNIW